MNWTEILAVIPGVTAIIGGGGKTTLMRTLGEELTKVGHTVLLCTTTKIFPFENLPCVTAFEDEELAKVLQKHPLICAGTPHANGKLSTPTLPMEQLATQFEYVLVEADGAAHRPMKAHADHEPMIPKEANQVISVVGASGFGEPILEAAHRAQRYAALANVPITTEITPEIAAAVLRAEDLGHRVLINQSELAPDAALKLVKLLECPAVAGSLHENMIF